MPIFHFNSNRINTTTNNDFSPNQCLCKDFKIHFQIIEPSLWMIDKSNIAKRERENFFLIIISQNINRNLDLKPEKKKIDPKKISLQSNYRDIFFTIYSTTTTTKWEMFLWFLSTLTQFTFNSFVHFKFCLFFLLLPHNRNFHLLEKFFISDSCFGWLEQNAKNVVNHSTHTYYINQVTKTFFSLLLLL